MGEDRIITNYFMSLSLTAEGDPVSQASVNWLHEDGIHDASDGPPEGVRVPIDDRIRECLKSRAT